MLAAARQSAAAALRDSRKRAAAHLGRKRRRAAALGLADGLQRAEVRIASQLQRFQGMYVEALQRLEQDAFQLAMKTARSVLDTEITSNPEAIQTQIRLGFAAIREQRALAVSCHPEDMECVLEALRTERTESPRVAADSSIPRGAARIDTIVGSLIVDWRDRFSRIQANLASRLATLLRAQEPHSQGGSR